MKNLFLYILGISLIVLFQCSGANEMGLDAFKYSVQKSNSFPDTNSTENDSTSIRPKPGNSPNTEPTEDDQEKNHDLKWI